jgi:hypothetical protein
MKGKFTEIEKREDGEVFISFTLPFERLENSKDKRLRKDIKMNSFRTSVNGGHIMKSPEVNSKPSVFKKFNQESGDEVNVSSLSSYINGTRKKEESKVETIKDQKDVSKIRNSIRLMEAPKLDDSQNKDSIYHEIEELKMKEEKERQELNSTIVPGRSKFPIKYTKKPEETKEAPYFQPFFEEKPEPAEPSYYEISEISNSQMKQTSLVSRIEAQNEANSQNLVPPEGFDEKGEIKQVGSKFSFKNEESDDQKSEPKDEPKEPKSEKKSKRNKKKDKKSKKKEKKEKKSKKNKKNEEKEGKS